MSFIPTETEAKGQGVGKTSVPPTHTPQPPCVVHGMGDIRCSKCGVGCKAAIEPLAFDAAT